VTDVWDRPGVYAQAEHIEIAYADQWASASVEIVMTEDGIWHSNPFIRDCAALAIADASIPDRRTHATRREAIDFHTASAREFFQKRLKAAENGCYRAAQVGKDAEIILAQIEELMARQQLDLFD
jgi:hypothetical protein